MSEAVRTVLNVGACLAFPLDVINLMHNINKELVREICLREDIIYFVSDSETKVDHFMMLAKTGFETRDWVRFVERVACKCSDATAQKVREKWLPKMRAI